MASIKKRLNRKGAVFMTPALFMLTVIHIYPTLATFYFSLTDSRLGQLSEFEGIKNYTTILTSRIFWNSLTVTVKFAAASVSIIFVLSLLSAMFIRSIPKFKGFFAFVIFMPVLLSESVTAVVWTMMLSPRGIINNYLLRFGIVESGIRWLTSSGYALAGIVMFMVWKGIGYFVVIFSVGLEEIPSECYDAAKIDGAGDWEMLTKITLPLLKPTVYLVVIVLLMQCFNVFAPFYIITGGGPYGTTEGLSMLIYDTGFKFAKMGKASAMSVIMIAILVLLSLILNRESRQNV